ncbi:NAD-dependent epimerase [Echinicola jeungdonensis]|uniref:NAD-dependent epimerase n=1 Tax=Echinicola jeungdonensis TaxID=709343 RepID=A0ABV5J4H5_9BACT|nr:NAD-dependent epimerase [Echinicola jeungdonensis]MDN3668110.1 NAD-dependent epimerase [Echinicola jeungdonensis]
MKILITGTAGFIGFHLAQMLLERGDTVVGLDSINDYYDIQLKYGRLAMTGIPYDKIKYGKVVHSDVYPNYRFIQLNLEDKSGIDRLFEEEQFDAVVNLAAQAGVRYSLENPLAYIDSNIVGFTHILEACRNHNTGHLVYASSSSVYGANSQMPFSTSHSVNHPVSLYAASKKSNELMAHTYSHLFNIPTTGLRFFTVYGPWGRPDMAPMIFTSKIIKGDPIKVFNYGDMQRDFTFIDDIVEGIVSVIDNPPKGNPDWNGEAPDPSSAKAPYKIYNIGNSNPVKLMDFIETIENNLGIKAKKELLPIQPGDVPSTYADTSELENDLGYKPETSIDQGVKEFVKWYRDFYKESKSIVESQES